MNRFLELEKQNSLMPFANCTKNLELNKAQAITFLHALTGCNQVLFFCSCKKTKAWNACINFLDVAETFMKLGTLPLKECGKKRCL